MDYGKHVLRLLILVICNLTNVTGVEIGSGELSSRCEKNLCRHLSSCFIKMCMFQVSSNFSYRNQLLLGINSELTEIPEHIIRCYTDRSLWNRYQRLPSSIDALVALIRYHLTEHMAIKICLIS